MDRAPSPGPDGRYARIARRLFDEETGKAGGVVFAPPKPPRKVSQAHTRTRLKARPSNLKSRLAMFGSQGNVGAVAKAKGSGSGSGSGSGGYHHDHATRKRGLQLAYDEDAPAQPRKTYQQKRVRIDDADEDEDEEEDEEMGAP